jgi:Na+/proline symporter
VPAAPAAPASRRRRFWLVAAAELVIAAVCVVAAIPIYRHGIMPHPFPSYVPGDQPYQVERYSAPWIAGAIALAGLAGILLILSIGRLVRRPAVVHQPELALAELP